MLIVLLNLFQPIIMILLGWMLFRQLENMLDTEFFPQIYLQISRSLSKSKNRPRENKMLQKSSIFTVNDNTNFQFADFVLM